MRKNRKLFAAGAAATVAIVGSGAGVAIAASSAGTHTLKFNSVETSTTNYGKTHFVTADKDVKAGKRIGDDVVSGSINVKAKTIKIAFAGALKGGIIYGSGEGTFTNNKFTGTVTGGTGIYKGATGVITGSSYGKNDNNEHLTIKYHK